MSWAPRGCWTGRAPVWTPPACGLFGGDLLGANPVDRAKPGCKWHLVVDATGMVLSLLLGPANRPDQELFAALLDEVPMVATPAVAGATARPSATPTRATTSEPAAGISPAGGSRCASPARVWSPRIGWVATAGRSSSRSRGGWAAAGCASATSAARSGSTGSGCWRAAGWRSTATSTRRPRGPAGPCWPGSHRRPLAAPAWAGAWWAAASGPVGASIGIGWLRWTASRACSGAAVVRLAGPGRPAAPSHADPDDPATRKTAHQRRHPAS
jgi:hypothetical protein